MKIIILMMAAILFFAEWYVIRKTNINKLLFTLATTGLAIPIGLFVGAHLVVFPVLMTYLALVMTEVEDWFKQNLKKKRLSEMQRSKMKDF